MPSSHGHINALFPETQVGYFGSARRNLSDQFTVQSDHIHRLVKPARHPQTVVFVEHHSVNRRARELIKSSPLAERTVGEKVVSQNSVGHGLGDNESLLVRRDGESVRVPQSSNQLRYFSVFIYSVDRPNRRVRRLIRGIGKIYI